MTETTPEDAADRGEIGEHEGDDVEGDDSVESDAGTDVDEGEESRESAREADGIDGELAVGVDVRDPFAEREPAIASKGPGLPRRGDVKGDGAGEE